MQNTQVWFSHLSKVGHKRRSGVRAKVDHKRLTWSREERKEVQKKEDQEVKIVKVRVDLI